jgi:TRAP-type transport system small permease protein
MMSRLINALAAMNRPIGLFGRNAAAVLVAVMTALVLLQIALRATTGVSLAWAEELARVSLVWSAFLVAPFAYRAGAHVAIDLFADALPRRLRIAMQLLLHGLVALILIMFFKESLAFWERGLSQQSATLPLPSAAFYSILPVAFVAMLLAGAELMLRHVVALTDPSFDPQVPDHRTVITPE